MIAYSVRKHAQEEKISANTGKKRTVKNVVLRVEAMTSGTSRKKGRKRGEVVLEVPASAEEADGGELIGS